MSSVGVGTRTYEAVESAVTANVESSSFTATAQIAQYVYRQLEQLAQRYKIPIARDLEFRGYDDNPIEFIRQLFGDIERLLEDGLISSIIFILSDPVIGNDGRYQVRYRVTYRVERDISPEHIGETGGRLTPPDELIYGAKFSIVAQWTPESAGMRAKAFGTGRYNFIWTPVNMAVFDDTKLPPSSQTGVFMPDEGELRVVRLEQARPTA